MPYSKCKEVTTISKDTDHYTTYFQIAWLQKVLTKNEKKNGKIKFNKKC